MKQNPTRPIILIEDNPMDVDLTMRAFQHNLLANPLQVLRDGEEALEYVTSERMLDEKPLLVLLDLKLPRVSGLDILREIRKRKELVFMPVVVLTSSAEDRDIQAAYQLGANSYILKPVNFEKFIEVAKNIKLYWLLLNTSA